MASVTVRRGDLYRVLGVTPAATGDEIVAAFRARAKALHPDRNPGDPEAAERFKDLTLAYQTLIRPRARAAFWSGVVLFLLGVAAAALLAALDTGDTGETVTLWIAAAKLLLGGPVLAGLGLLRLRRLATGE